MGGSRPTKMTNLTERWVYVPIWIVFVAFGLPTALLWYGDRQRRTRPGHCQKCGYDLTKNESGVCPECGVEIPEAAAGKP